MSENTPTVMIVEDEMLLRMELEDILTSAGFEVVSPIRDSDDAIALPETQKVDAAVLNIHLWGKKLEGIKIGLELWARYQIPALYISGSLDAETRHAAAPGAPIGFINKPHTPEKVVTHLNEYLFSAHSDEASRPHEPHDQEGHQRGGQRDQEGSEL